MRSCRGKLCTPVAVHTVRTSGGICAYGCLSCFLLLCPCPQLSISGSCMVISQCTADVTGCIYSLVHAYGGLLTRFYGENSVCSYSVLARRACHKRCAHARGHDGRAHATSTLLRGVECRTRLGRRLVSTSPGEVLTSAPCSPAAAPHAVPCMQACSAVFGTCSAPPCGTWHTGGTHCMWPPAHCSSFFFKASLLPV